MEINERSAHRQSLLNMNIQQIILKTLSVCIPTGGNSDLTTDRLIRY